MTVNRHERQPMATIISIASGKGGVGKSIIAANLALLLAKAGKRVVLADLDIGGADCHVLFGMLNPSVTLTDFLNRRVESLEDVAHPLALHPQLRLIPGTGETLATANMPYARKKRLIRHFHEMEADVIIADIGAGTSYHVLDFFLMADHHLVVATPDPTSVLDLYRFVKLAAIRRVLSNFLARDPMGEALSDRDFSSVGEVLAVAGETDHAGRETVEAALRSFRPWLVVNRQTENSRVNVLGLRTLLHNYVGSDLVMLGEIPDDRSIERSVRGFLPVMETEPQAPAAHSLRALCHAVLHRMSSSSAVKDTAAVTI